MLNNSEIEVEKIDVSESKENLKLMKGVAGKSVTTVPQVVIDGKFVGGYTEVERFINRL
jgi:glutaredoxin